MNGSQIRYGIGFNVDKTGLNDLTKTLRNVQTELSKASGMDKQKQSIDKTVQAAKQLEQILNSAWNSKLNQLDLSKVNSGIKSTFGSVQQLKAQMEGSGASGAAAYNKVASAILNTNLQLKQSNKLLDDMADTMAKTVKWGIASSIFNRISGSIQEAWGFTKRLDNSLNDIRIVTGKSADEMQRFAKQANEAAKALGKGTVDYTDASLIYFQQGLSDEEVAARAEVTLKAANVTGQSTEEVSEQLTAVWNGYKVSAQEAELYVDKLAAVAATTAADLEELSTGMSKVASAANSMGVDIDQLNAQLATIVSVTRQAPESVGTALKTIYARLGDLAVDGEDEFGVALGQVSGTMAEMGIQILDSQGQMRNMGTVIEETAAKWDTWSEAQRQAAAVAIAGKRQYNNLIALFDNWDMYTESLNTSVDATGTLQKQQDTYMESVEAHLKQLSAEAEKTYDVLFNENVIKGFTDALSGTLGLFNDFIEGIGGGGKALVYFGTLATRIFNKQIAAGIQNSISNIKVALANAGGEKARSEYIAEQVATHNDMNGDQIASKKALEAQYKIAGDMLKVQKGLTVEQQQQYIEIERQIGLNTQQIYLIQDRKAKAHQLLGDEEATLLMAQAREKIEKENLIEQRQAQALYRENLMLVEKEGPSWANKRALIQSITALNSTLSLDAEKQLITEAAKKDILEQGRLSEKNRLQLEELINSKISTQKQYHVDIVNLVKLMEAHETGKTEQIEEQNKQLLQQKNALDKSGESSLKMQKNISVMSALAQATTVAFGSLETILDSTADKASKAQAVGSSLAGIANSIGMAFGPVGMAIGMTVSSIISLISSAYSKAVQEQQKKIEEVKKDWENLANDITVSNENISSLEGMTSEFEYLANGVSRYGENISLTADEYSRYQSIVNDIAEKTPDLVEGYTKEGNAIADKNKLIEESIRLLQEEQKEKKKALLEDEKIDLLAEGLESDYNKTTKKIKKAENRQEEVYATNTNLIHQYNPLAEAVGSIASMAAYTDNKEMQEELNNVKKLYQDIDAETGSITINQDKLFKNKEEIYKQIQEIKEKYNLQYEDEDIAEWIAGLEEQKNLVDKEVEELNQEKEALSKGFNDKVLTWIEVYNADYETLTREQQLIIQKYIQNLSSTDFSKEGFEALVENAEGFLEIFTNLHADTQAEILALTDPSSYETYQDYLQGLWTLIKNPDLSDEDLKAIAQALNISDLYREFDENGNVVSYVADDMIGKIQDINTQVREKIGDKNFDISQYFSYNEIEKGSFEDMGGIDFSKVTSIDDFIAKLDVIKSKNFGENIVAQITATKNNLQEVNNALTEFGEKGELSPETIELLERKYADLGKIQNKNSTDYILALQKIGEIEENNLETLQKQSLEHKKQLLENQQFELESQLKAIKLEQNALFSKNQIAEAVQYNEEIANLSQSIENVKNQISDLDNESYTLNLSINSNDIKSDIENAFITSKLFNKIALTFISSIHSLQF